MAEPLKVGDRCYAVSSAGDKYAFAYGPGVLMSFKHGYLPVVKLDTGKTTEGLMIALWSEEYAARVIGDLAKVAEAVLLDPDVERAKKSKKKENTNGCDKSCSVRAAAAAGGGGQGSGSDHRRDRSDPVRVGSGDHRSDLLLGAVDRP